MREAVAIVAGLAIAAVAEFIALMLAGAGHGWVAAWPFSLILFAAYPAALFRMPIAVGKSAMLDIAMLVVGVVASLLLLAATNAEAEYFWKVVHFEDGLQFIIVWLLLWFGWQALTLANVVRKRRRGRAG